MSRSVQLVLLCEDTQHETFARRFLEKAGWSTRRLRVVKAPPGRGSAVQFIRERFPIELSAYRSNRNRVTLALVVMVDGERGLGTSSITRGVPTCSRTALRPRDSIARRTSICNGLPVEKAGSFRVVLEQR